MKTFRQVIFWMHLVAGLVAGIAIGIMCFTGTALAFEKELLAWSERDARRVEPPAGAVRLPLEDLQRRLREAQPEARPMSIVVYNDPQAAVAFSAGRTGGFYVDPYSGEVRSPESSAMGGFMQTMIEWHRYLSFSGETSRPRGKLVNGICNLAFCVLAISGVYLWMPREWSWRAVKPVIWFRQNNTSKARDFNLHNVIGFWSAPVLMVLTLTAVPISFQWGGRLISQLTGTPPTAPGAAAAQPPVEVPAPPPGTRPLGQEALLATVQREMPRWTTITIRSGGGGRGGRGEGRPAETAPANTAPSGNSPRGPLPAATFTVRERGTWPRTATTTLALNPYTGEVLRRTGYAEFNGAQKVRAWTRFLHTGEALGPVGQFVAGLACLGGCFLVYTGFALAWRRFFGRKETKAQPANVG